MNIDVICFPFVGDSRGGSYVSSAILIKELQKRGRIVKVILHCRGRLTDYFDNVDIDYTVLPLQGMAHVQRSRASSSFVMGMLCNLWRIYQLIKKENISIVHTNDARIHLFWSLPTKLARVIHIWHQRTHFRPSRMTEFFLRRASTVVCISKYIANSLPANLRGEKFIVPNAVPPTRPPSEYRGRYRKLIFEKAELSSELKIIGWFSTLRSLKRPDVFAQALAKLSVMYPYPIIAVIFGEDRESWEPRMLAELHRIKQQNRMLFMGHVDDIYPWMSSCDLVVSTSINDGFGRTLIEAMHLGVPVIAAEAGGHPEIITHDKTGWLVQPNDPNDTAQAMCKLLSDENLCCDLVKNAQAVADSKYSTSAHCSVIENIYNKSQ